MIIIKYHAYLTGQIKYVKDAVYARCRARPSPVGKVQGKELEHRVVVRGVVHRDATDLVVLSETFVFQMRT